MKAEAAQPRADIDDTYAEAFRSIYAECLITARDRTWLDHAVSAATGNASSTILCDCGCHPQSVWDCACGRAAELRDEIAGMIRTGRTGDQVIEEFVARQGEQVRIAPLARGFNLVAWLGPAFLFFGAAVAIVLVLRRWRRSAPAAPDAQTPVAAIDPDDPYLARLRDDLERFP